jgi:hypothetical protein
MTSSPYADRRVFLADAGRGIAGLALGSLLGAQARGTGDPPHFRPRARSVIWLFMRGGLSHLESFDPKPVLAKLAGKKIAETEYKSVQSPERLGKVRVVVVNDANGQQRDVLMAPGVPFRRYGASGLPFSDWFAHTGACADDIAVIRSMWTTDDNHGAQVQFLSGRHMLDGNFPTIGAWVTWGLGTLNENLPQFVSMGPHPNLLNGDGRYLGPAYDAVRLAPDPSRPLPYARPEREMTADEQRVGFDLVGRLNRLREARDPDDATLRARIRSYELAFRMQASVPEVLGLAGESDPTRRLYGLDQAVTQPFGTQLLVARRLVERGVRFVQIMHGDGAAGEWDAHQNLRANHSGMAAKVDRPIAGLLVDLKRRGLLDQTVVVFATEFGRTPGSQNGDGRDHHPYGFSVWMAGGGIKGGVVEGATDEIGFHAVEKPHYVTDVHATLLHLMGLRSHWLELPDHKRLEMEFGEVIRDILA